MTLDFIHHEPGRRLVDSLNCDHRLDDLVHLIAVLHPRDRDKVNVAHRVVDLFDAIDGVQLLAGADQQADGESGIDKVDPMIAAVADIYDEPVLTANIEHFDALDVDVEAY
jgi:predicted nucleic acid-binding protein